jgi:hypothetical protein
VDAAALDTSWVSGWRVVGDCPVSAECPFVESVLPVLDLVSHSFRLRGVPGSEGRLSFPIFESFSQLIFSLKRLRYFKVFCVSKLTETAGFSFRESVVVSGNWIGAFADTFVVDDWHRHREEFHVFFHLVLGCSDRVSSLEVGVVVAGEGFASLFLSLGSGLPDPFSLLF